MKEESKWEKNLCAEIANFFRKNSNCKVLVERESPQPDLFYDDPTKIKSWNHLCTVDIALKNKLDELIWIIEFEKDVNPKNFYGVIMASVIASQTFQCPVDFYYVVPENEKRVDRGNWLLSLISDIMENYPNIMVKPVMSESQFKEEIGFTIEA